MILMVMMVVVRLREDRRTDNQGCGDNHRTERQFHHDRSSKGWDAPTCGHAAS